MNNDKAEQGVFFIYDGECPICCYAAQATRIRQQLGPLHLIDARSESTHPLVKAISSAGMDLDEGMVIVYEEQYYHGVDALNFLARFSEPVGWFNQTNVLLFRYKWLAYWLYPWMRGMRNWLLKRKATGRIDNLQLSTQPTFSHVLAQDWDALPVVFKKHYANRPYTRDHVIVFGELNVATYGIMKLLQPFYRLLGIVPAVTESNVPVTVHFESDPHSKAFRFNRQFHFKQHKPYHFLSRMIPIKDNCLIEVMGLGICWCLRYEWHDSTLWLHHEGYALKWFGHLIPLPLTWLLGRGDATETAIDDDHFDMRVDMHHPLFGHLYHYSGRFKVIKTA